MAAEALANWLAVQALERETDEELVGMLDAKLERRRR